LINRTAWADESISLNGEGTAGKKKTRGNKKRGKKSMWGKREITAGEGEGAEVRRNKCGGMPPVPV
jgi:hypothetical protein